MTVTVVKTEEVLVENEKQKQLTAARWRQIRDDYIDTNLEPERDTPFTLKALSEKWGVKYGTMRNRAGNESWNAKLDELREERTDLARTVTNNYVAYEEAEVRGRQARIARVALAKAAEKLDKLKPGEMTVREAIELARMGFEQERKALGMSDKVDVSLQNLERPALEPVDVVSLVKKFMTVLDESQGKVIEGEVVDAKSEH